MILLLHVAFAVPTTCSLDPSVLVDEKVKSFYIRGDLVNLRNGPSTKDKIKTEIRLGTDVEVEKCSKKETIGGKEGCWHKVNLEQENKAISGYLFSTALTSCRIEGDFDTDGVNEFVYYSINRNNRIQLRLQDPNNKPHVFWKDIGDYKPATKGQLGLIPVIESGKDLLYFKTWNEESGSYEHSRFFSYHPKLGIQEALRVAAPIDRPNQKTKTVTFLPSRQVQVIEQVVQNQYPKENRSGTISDTKAKKRSLCLEQGVYTKCPEPNELHERFYAVQNNKLTKSQTVLILDFPSYKQEGLNEPIREVSRQDMVNLILSKDVPVPSEEWWILSDKGEALRADIKRYTHSIWECMDEVEDRYHVEFSLPDNVNALLAVNGPPPAAWFHSQPKDFEEIRQSQDAIAKIVTALKEKEEKINPSVLIKKNKNSWQGVVSWCCPDYTDLDGVDLKGGDEYVYMMDVSIAQDNVVFQNKRKDFIKVGFYPIIEMDIDGDNILEVLRLADACEGTSWDKDGVYLKIKTPYICCGC
jgi:hypothetical protein